MNNPPPRRPSPAMVVACLALVAAVSGTAVAAKKVGTKQIKKGAVKTRNLAKLAVKEGKLADHSVGTAQLLPGAVGTNKLQDAAVTGPKVANGSLGPAKIAQAPASVSASFTDVDGSECQPSDDDITVPGMQLGDDVLAYPKDANQDWDTRFILDGYAPTGDDTIRVMACNISAQNDAVATLPLQVLLFR